ncbi:hypothetical protein K457DRAFT_14206 [Linnemannia elongata AG-77]|uniref:RNI-like protein n=1 Tax=Linnemannia elongata AG-77 TaxID=1314771 RepID=A0A197K9J5_9FUNG|nr:hypothetical protein K457DRAFT_14206 [Linnemannia elongata AG-77]
MTLHQRFRHGDRIELLPVRKDKTTGEFYIREKDVQRVFLGATLFKVDGVVLYYLEDENEQEYEPKRIAYYPDDTIDVVIADHAHTSMSPGASLPPSTSIHTDGGNQCDQSLMLPTQELDLAVSTLSMQPALPTPTPTGALVRTPFQPILPPTIISSNVGTLQQASIARPMAMLSTMALDITQLQQQLERSTDQQSVYHQQQMQQLINMVQQQNDMVAQQNEMVRQQNLMLQEQAASREREERILQEQAESKIREEQMLKMQQETIDRLIVNQQRVDALLVQNYELHEYPIPRLFVVLPDSFGDWDPRSFLMERFRLYFLCECDGDCGSGAGQGASSEQLGIDAATSTKPIPVKNSVHLAKHEGYELSRATEFFGQYGPYVLGMLKILQHCLAVAAVAAPVAALADSGLKDVMDGVKSISESTMQAVDMSINILETKLGDAYVADNFTTIASDGHDNTMFENLAALEGADLRRLDTFLRNNDKDKILGNLYRIIAEQGQVKWVCFDHYKETYRHTALASFVQSVETGGGTYDPHLGQVTISLESATTSKDFFRRLVSQAPAVQTLDVTLDWAFGSADLVTLVDMVSKSNVKVFKLDLHDDYTSNPTIASLRPGKGRYHSLLDLLSNTKLRSLQLSNLYLLGTRTSNLTPNFDASWLQSFSVEGIISEKDQHRLTSIISHCSQLEDLRLISVGWGFMELSLQQAVFSLKKLRQLHLGDLHIDQDSNANDLRSMKEIFYYTVYGGFSMLTKTIRQSGPVLEVLILESSLTGVDIVPADLSPIPLLSGRENAPAVPLTHVPHLSALTHLDLSVPLTDPSLLYLSTILPRLDLVHFGCNHQSQGLLQHCNLASLQSLSIKDTEVINLNFLGSMGNGTAGLTWDGLKQLYIRNATPHTKIATRFLQSTPLTQLYLDNVDSEHLTEVLEVVNLSKLQEISIYGCLYSPSAEQALAKRANEFTESLVVRLDGKSYLVYFKQGGKSRSNTDAGSLETLPRHRVIDLGYIYSKDHHYSFLKPILPVHSF